LSQVAAAVWSDVWSEIAPSPAPVELVRIAPAPAVATLAEVAAPAPRKVASWEDLPAGEQQIHLRAQRFARVQAAEMRLREADAVQAGRAQKNLYETLRQQIDGARTAFRKAYFATCRSMVDYLHLELVKTLANDDVELMGQGYPGPLGR
jgi:hypothetical protein